MKQSNCMAITIKKLIKVMAALMLIFPVGYAIAAPCDLKPSSPLFIRHDLTANSATSVSYCELCGYGYVTIIITNPYVGSPALDVTNMVGMTVVENLQSSGLTYFPGATTPYAAMQYSVNGGAYVAGGAPNISGPNGSVLTWTGAQINALNSLAPQPGINSFSTIAIRFAVKRNASLSQEALITANRSILASLNYSTNPACVVNSTVTTGANQLPLREPLPSIQKAGRNVDAGQTNYTNPLYGTNNDDIVWRIQFNTNSTVPMQDIRFDDAMAGGSMQINYACPTEAAALNVANNNGTLPGGSPCIPSSNSINNFVLNPNFGDPNPLYDVPASGNTRVYLVGKVVSNGACTGNRTNTVSDVQWGCLVDTPAGGITTSSTGITPAASASFRSLVVPSGLSITAALTGTFGNPNVGSKGVMTLTVTNNSRGAIRNIKLKNILPAQYVVDPTFVPVFAITRTTGYDNYSGEVNSVLWTNPVANTFPLRTTSTTAPLGNNQPEFSLLSVNPHGNGPNPPASLTYATNPGDTNQFNMLRQGEVVTITFNVVMINTNLFDRVADLDVDTEDYLDGTDPNTKTILINNKLSGTYEDFCDLSPLLTKNFTTHNATFTADQEDLDIVIPEKVYVLTDTQVAPFLPLDVVVTNHGGHDARDYHVFVTFGATMKVENPVPPGCTPILHPGSPAQPDPWKIWIKPAAIPAAPSTVYNCVPAGGSGLPDPMPRGGGTQTLRFYVSKNLANLAADDLTFRADVVGEIMLTNPPPAPELRPQYLWFPAPIIRADGQTDRANNYSLDGYRSRVIGFNLSKAETPFTSGSQVGFYCGENNPFAIPDTSTLKTQLTTPDSQVQIGEECNFKIRSGGWFGFQTPGFTYIAVRNVTVTDELPSGAVGSPPSAVSPLSKQGYISSTNPALTSDTGTGGLVFSTTGPSSAPAPPNVGWVAWTFNDMGSDITVKDKYFDVSIISRILNDPLNLHTVQSSNIINSIFEAIFLNTSGAQSTFTIDKNIIGYPQETERRINLRVTEPNLNLTKSVCNETVSIAANAANSGKNCSPFVNSIVNIGTSSPGVTGDAHDNYVYKITLKNEDPRGQPASGYPRAPAYDVTVTDTLDTSGLMIVNSFATDSLDNDFDGMVDGADTDGEGINNTPVSLAFSYNNSIKLKQINDGQTVELYYRVDPDNNTQPGQILVNTVNASYSSLLDVNGAESNPLLPSGNVAGERLYNALPVTSTITMVNPTLGPKKILLLSQANHAPPVSTGSQPVSIGEEIQYQLEAFLPVTKLRNFIIRDVLPVGIRCSQAPVVNLPAGNFSPVPPSTLAITPTCTDTLVEWNFGDQVVTNPNSGLIYDLKVNFIGRIENTTNTNNGNTLSNGATPSAVTASYKTQLTSGGPDVPVTLTLSQPSNVVVQEPVITISKAFSSATADAGDILMVTVTVSNNNPTSTATAYNVKVVDDMTGIKLTYVGGSVGGTGPPDIVDTSVPNRPIFIWNAIPAGVTGTRTFTYQVTVNSGASGVQPLETITNTIQATWDSLPGRTTSLVGGAGIGPDGAPDGLRDGVTSPALLNKYFTSASASFTVTGVSITKTDDTSAPGIPAVGEIRNFHIDILLPEGTTQNLVLTDNLAALPATLGYLLPDNATDITYYFRDIASITKSDNTVTSPTLLTTITGGNPGGFNSIPANNTNTNAIWNIGTVVTMSEDDSGATHAVNPLIRISYRVRIDNAAAGIIAAGKTLYNSAVANYRDGTSGLTTSSNSVTLGPITVVEPQITLNKTVVDLGASLRYTLTMTAANGALNSEAFDVAITETLSTGLTYMGGSAKLNGVAAEPSVSGLVLSWNLANGNNIDIPKGGIVTLIYDVSFATGTTSNLTSTSLVQWTSLDDTLTSAGPAPFTYTTHVDERDGSYGNLPPLVVGPNYDYYFTTISVNRSPYPNNTGFTKTRLSDTYEVAPPPGDANVRIGDLIDYQLTVHLSQGTTLSAKVVDILPQGIDFVSVVSINGDTSADYSSGGAFSYADISGYPSIAITKTGNASTGPTTITWNLGDITNSDTTNNNPISDFVIVYRARVLNGTAITTAPVSQGKQNDAVFSYLHTSGTTLPANASVTVLQPLLSISKVATPLVPRTKTTLLSGDVVQYDITVTNVAGGAPAYDVVVKDVIPYGMRNGASTISSWTATINGSPITPTLTYDIPSNTATWELHTTTPDQYAIPPGGTLHIVYTVTLNSGLAAGLSMVNSAYVFDYCSLDSANANAVGRKCYGATTPVTDPVSTKAASSLSKVNWPGSEITAAIGQPFTYRITVPATPETTTLYDVHVLDILDDLSGSAVDMSLVSVTAIAGPAAGPATWTPVVTGAPKNLNIDTGVDIAPGQQIVMDVTVVLNNETPITRNTTGKVFVNSATYSFNQINATETTRTTVTVPGTASRTIVGPETLAMAKSGPVTMSLGVPGTFTLDLKNNGTGTAWNMTIEDRLPQLAQGGMCNTTPNIVQVVKTNGIAPPIVLNVGTDYTVNFVSPVSPALYCTLSLSMLSTSNAALNSGYHYVVTYQASLNNNILGGLSLTNVAAATQWYSASNIANPYTPHQYSYSFSASDPGTTSNPNDPEAAHSLTTEAPILQLLKAVRNVTTGQNPGSNASPGDILHYTITINNLSPLDANNFRLTDELDRLNATAMFMPGTLVLTNIPATASVVFTSATGGSKGTGLVDIRNLTILGNGSATIDFEVRLASVITNGTVVLNQAQLPSINVVPVDSDDPFDAAGAFNPMDTPQTRTIEPTKTTITSAPLFQVRKTSQDITGDPLVLLAGERLRYTITVKNIGNENANNVKLRDPLPPNTTYVAGSTRLNGVVVADIAGVSPLQAGMLIHAPTGTAGDMRADASLTPTPDNVATITFEVQINNNVLNGTIISNQGFVTGTGLGSGNFPEKPSDDPATATPDDPTLNIVGNLPLLVAQKTVAIVVGGPVLQPLNVLRYTITITNLSAIPANNVNITDPNPNPILPILPLFSNTTYIVGSTTLNGVSVPDNPSFPLLPGVGGTLVSSPTSPTGTIDAHESAVVTFDVQVNAGVTTGTVISNQGSVTSSELPNLLTDADGNSSNGYQPTTIIVGSAQQIAITKQVAVVGGGAALPGAELEYLVSVTNNGSVAATPIITDNLSIAPLPSQINYVAGSATLNGVPITVTGSNPIITINYGTLAPGATAQLRFRVLITAGLPMGTTITNTGQVDWSASPTLTATASVSIDVGGVPGSANLNGHLWHDANFNKLYESVELNLAGWSVGVYRNNVSLGSVTTDAGGLYSVSGLTPTTSVADQYSIRFLAPGANATTAKLGRADSTFINGMQVIGAITALSGNNLQNLNLPISPNGVVYNSILRTPVTGAMLTMVRAGSLAPLSPVCFEDTLQQGQVTLSSGYYKFDLNFSDLASCPSGADYLIQVTSPLVYMPGQSQIIPPLTYGTTATFNVPTCPLSAADAIPATANYCEAQPSEFAPGLAILANTVGTNYYLKMAFNNTVVPGHSQIFDNHIAMDPRLDNAVTITKIAALQNVTKGQLIPYTITVSNTLPVTLNSMSIVDTFPPGFKYVSGSGRLDGLPVEPVATTRTLTWGNLQLATNTKRVIQLMLIVGSGVKEGKYVNRAQVFNTITGGAGSPEAAATVRVIPDPTLDCSDVIGKVFDDANLNGYQDEGEKGLAGVRVVTARGLIVTTDKYGRFHLTCAVVPDPDRGSNFILKIDDRSLPSGYRITTENPRVQRATRGKMLKFNFGAAIHKIVKLDVADGVFEAGTTEMRVQWKQRVELLMNELKKAPSVLRLSYLGEAESEGLVDSRIKLLKSEVSKLWKLKKGNYDLTIESEIFWRTGSPPEKSEASH